MNESLQPLYSLLTGKFGWLPTAMGWLAASRVAFKAFSAAIQARLTAKLAAIAESNDTDEIGWIEGMLSNRGYKIAAFTIDLALSLKLPSLADFQKVVVPPAPKVPYNKPIVGAIVPVLLLASALAFSGCGHATLEQGGAYAPATTNAAGVVTATVAPDYAFFIADSAFDLAVSALDATFTFERVNRAMLWQISPQIKHGLDQVRPEAVALKVDYARARAVYIANPVPANLTTLQAALAKAQQLSATAAALLPAQVKTP